MKELTESLVLMIDAKVITRKEAKEIFSKAIAEWMGGHEHEHDHSGESN